MNEMIERVSFEMQRYCVEESVDGTFWIEDGYRNAIVRLGLTAHDEPQDVCDELNARAAIAAMREPTDAMVKQGEMAAYEYRADPADWTLKLTKDAWRAMIDAALKD